MDRRDSPHRFFHLVVAALAASCLAWAGPARAQTNHVAGLWHFDEGSGGSAYDSSGNGNTGTLAGPTWSTNFKFGDPGAADALSFDGTDDYVDVPVLTGGSLDITGSLTLGVWVNVTANTTGGYQELITKWDYASPSDKSYALELDPCASGKLCPALYVAASPSTKCVLTSPVPITPGDGAWHEVVGTFDATSGDLDIYLDGVLTATTTGSPCTSIQSTSTDVLLGAQNPISGEKFFLDGVLDEASVWNRALSPQEVLASAQTGLRGLWHFNEGTGTTTADSSGYANTGTLNGATFGGPSGNVGSGFGDYLSFDGTDDYVSVPNSSSLSALSQITVDAWINPATSSPKFYPAIVDKGNVGSYAESYALFLTQSDTLGFLVNSNGTSSGRGVVFGATAIPTGTWTHVAGTYDGSEVCVWVNGAEDTCASQTGPIHQTPDPVLIGESYRAGSAYFTTYYDGDIDEVHIWARALSGPEIAFLAAAGTRAPLFVPEEVSQELPAGSVFTSDWHVGTTTPAMGLAFSVPNDPGNGICTTVDSGSTPPGTSASLLGYQTGMTTGNDACSPPSGLAELLTGESGSYRNEVTLHLGTYLSNLTGLGMNMIWSK